MKVEQLSDKKTSGEHIGDSTGVVWTNIQGTKKSHDVEITQANYKDAEGNHYFYNPKTGVQGMAGGNRDKK